jgi:DNA-directed RNA polymerase specialized sigma24 family protein
MSDLMSTRPLELLARDWPVVLRGPLRRRFAAWCEAEPALARFTDAGAVVRFLQGAGCFEQKDAALLALLVRARFEALAGRVVLEAIRPGLLGLLGRLPREPAWREEAQAVMLAAAWRRIRRYPVERRTQRVAANLLLDTLHDTTRAIGKLASAAAGTAPWSALAEKHVAADEQVDGDVDALLDDAVKAGAISGVEAELILASRIDGASLHALAHAAGVSYNTMKLRRQRAERRLFVFLGVRPVPQRGGSGRSVVARVTGSGPAGPVGGQ